MKKKLAGIDLRVQLAVVVIGLLLLAFAGYTLAVSPQNAQATKLQKAVAAEQILISQQRATLRAREHAPTIKVAELFRLSRAMPDREDMPGMILTLSQVARNAGIKFDLIQPVPATVAPALSTFQTQRIHLLFNGDFYALSDFLYRLRSLVAVRHGELLADGRLFNVDTVTFQAQPDLFPQISAEVYVNAYVYSGAAAPVAGAAGATTPGTTTTPDTSTTPAPAATETPPAGATATGVTP